MKLHIPIVNYSLGNLTSWYIHGKNLETLNTLTYTRKALRNYYTHSELPYARRLRTFATKKLFDFSSNFKIIMLHNLQMQLPFRTQRDLHLLQMPEAICIYSKDWRIARRDALRFFRATNTQLVLHPTRTITVLLDFINSLIIDPHSVGSIINLWFALWIAGHILFWHESLAHPSLQS